MAYECIIRQFVELVCFFFSKWRSVCLSFKEYKLLGNVPCIFLHTCQNGRYLHRNKRRKVVRAGIETTKVLSERKSVQTLHLKYYITVFPSKKLNYLTAKHLYICGDLLDKGISELQKNSKNNLCENSQILCSETRHWSLSKCASKGRLDSLKSICEKSWKMMGLDISEKGRNPSVLEFRRNYFE